MPPRSDDVRRAAARAKDTQGASGCPVDFAHTLLSGRWRLSIIAVLINGPARFSELRRALPEISANILTQKLRQLQADGLVYRASVASSPPIYSLSDFGSGIRPVVEAIRLWAARRSKL